MALASTATWLLVTLGTPFAAHGNALLLGLVALTASAWYGGVGPGLLTTLLGLLSVDYLFPALKASGSVVPPDGCAQPSLPRSPSSLVRSARAKQHAEDDLEQPVRAAALP